MVVWIENGTSSRACRTSAKAMRRHVRRARCCARRTRSRLAGRLGRYGSVARDGEVHATVSGLIPPWKVVAFDGNCLGERSPSRAAPRRSAAAGRARSAPPPPRAPCGGAAPCLPGALARLPQWTQCDGAGGPDGPAVQARWFRRATEPAVRVRHPKPQADGPVGEAGVTRLPRRGEPRDGVRPAPRRRAPLPAQGPVRTSLQESRA
jgi:hypothetical protein